MPRRHDVLHGRAHGRSPRRSHGGSARRLRRRLAAAGLALALVAGACSSAAHQGTPTSTALGQNAFFRARFTARTNRFTFGQDPSWTPDGRVLSNEPDPSGVNQVYVSGVDGSQMSCLTCGQPGPNGFPQERPQGDWILFCSFRGQAVTFGSPCLGGIGTDLYVMRPDGTHVTRLTAPGQAHEPAGVLEDNYHPYWSPDGRHLVWTHLDFDDRAHGGTQWTMLLADFTPDAPGGPALTDVRVVGPAGDHAYETQAWAPDGSGFLYTALSSGGDANIGWLNAELYELRIAGPGASPEHPVATHLTDSNPGWDEQAVFTPDGRDVIWMSSRGTPTWYQNVVTAAQTIGYDPPLENHTAGPMFVLTVLDPKFRTDLYELDLSSRATRRLTNLDRVIPEFAFDPTGTRLLWTDGELDRTYVGTFAGVHPVRVGSPPPVDPAWTGAPRHGDRTRPRPVQAKSHVTVAPASLPAAVGDGVVLLEAQLSALTARLHDLPAGGSCCTGTPGSG